MARIDDGSGQPARTVDQLVPAEGTSLYVHFPFCVAKCTYCDFFSLAADGHDPEGDLEVLLEELDRRAPPKPRTVFLGGGTPSLHATKDLVRFLDRLDERTGFRASAVEVTLEANPESLDLEKAQALRAAGVQRLSIGVQSLEPRILERFGRVHDAEQGLRALEIAAEAGFERFSADLIYGVDEQQLEAWRPSLDQVIERGVTHLSLYSLAYEEGTLMTRWKEEGLLQPLEEEIELAFFEATHRQAEEAGFEAYEVSNFARAGQRCEHNLNYWRNGEYVGLGPSAVSYLQGTRFGNPRHLGEWRSALRAGQSAASWEETLRPVERLGETWWLGLRTREGVDPAEARETARFSGSDPAEPEAQRLEMEGWLEREGPRYRWSARGLPLIDALARRFLQVCGTQRPKGEGTPEGQE